MCPPTEREGTTNPKYGYDELFERVPFSGTTKKMQYMYGPKRSTKRPPPAVEERKMGGPNEDFLKKHGLDEKSHPIEWFNALLPILPESNKEDPAVVNVKGDKKTKFSASNWTKKYSNTRWVFFLRGKVQY